MASSPEPTSSGQNRVETAFPTTSSPYQYKPLAASEIRVLVLHPGASTDPISIGIVEISLDEVDDAFEALSYTWAPRDPWKEVCCGNAKLPVAANLHDALVALRVPDKPRLFWIDQIAINQRDVTEKNAQVQLMGQIYAKAVHVMIWLSVDLWVTRDMDHLYAFSRLCRSAAEVGVEQALRDATGEGELTEAAWQAMFRLLQSDYFGRVWMIQEIVRAKQCWIMLFGSCMEWDGLVEISMLFQSKLERHYPTLRELHPTIRFQPSMRLRTRALQKMVTIRMRLRDVYGGENIWSHGPKWTLLDMLRKTWNFEATDERDKVYAVVGLLDFSRHCRATAIRPDYSAGTVFTSVIRSVFLESLTEQGGLECLGYCTSACKESTPSWMGAVDIRFYTPHQVILYDLWDAGGMAAGQDSDHVRRVSSGDSLISFRVTHLGKMGHILGPLPGESDVEERVRHSQQPQEYFESQGGTSFDELEAYWLASKTLAETVISNSSGGSDLFHRAFFFDVDPFSDNSARIYSFRRNSRQLVDYDFEDRAVTRPDLFGLMDRFRFGVTDAASSPRKQSLLCWVPPHVRDDDLLCVVHGYRFPMVVRPVRGANNHYRFFGISYVQGYMDGEALSDGDLVTEDLIFA